MRFSLSRTTWLTTLGWLCALALLLQPLRAGAQGYTLQVTLHNTSGAAIAGVTIVTRTEGGEELTRQMTGSDGSVSFSGLAGVVRIAVEGQPQGGPRLYQLGDDARGMRVDLDQAALPLTLNLRAEPDGLVLPDPETMLTLEAGGPLVGEASLVPTAAVATPAPLPTSRSTAISPGTGSSPEEQTPPQAGWVPPLTLLVVVAAAMVLRLVQKLRSTR